MNTLSATPVYLVSCFKDCSARVTALLCNEEGKISCYKVGRALTGAALHLASCITAVVVVSELPIVDPVPGNFPFPSPVRLLCGSLSVGCGFLSEKILNSLIDEIPPTLRLESKHRIASFIPVLPPSPQHDNHFLKTIDKTGKVFKIVIVNDIHIGPAKKHYNGIARSCPKIVQKRLPKLLQNIKELHAPDLIVNLGDLINSSNKEVDLENYKRLIPLFKKLNSPVLHLVGNHELKRMSLAEVEQIWQASGFKQKSYGYIEMGEFTLVWLGLSLEKKGGVNLPFLPEEQVSWLREHFQKHNRPTLLFMHCPVDDQDLDGEFYYEGCQRENVAFFLENQSCVRDIIIRSDSGVAVFQAHLHRFYTKKIDNVSFITCPAMGDNLMSSSDANNRTTPDVYTLVTLDSDNGKFTIKAFSGNYTIGGYEDRLNHEEKRSV